MTALSLGIINATVVAERAGFSWRGLVGRFLGRPQSATLFHRCLALHMQAARGGALS